MEIIALESLARMRKGMNILDTIITAAPMLGIMGTVLGIITSFDMLGAAGAASEPRAVIGGIAQALITTASGLGIAVVTIFPTTISIFALIMPRISWKSMARGLNSSGRGRKRNKHHAHAQNAPPCQGGNAALMDVVFLILVFLIYAMMVMVVHMGMPVALPTSQKRAARTDGCALP